MRTLSFISSLLCYVFLLFSVSLSFASSLQCVRFDSLRFSYRDTRGVANQDLCPVGAKIQIQKTCREECRLQNNNAFPLIAIYEDSASPLTATPVYLGGLLPPSQQKPVHPVLSSTVLTRSSLSNIFFNRPSTCISPRYYSQQPPASLPQPQTRSSDAPQNAASSSSPPQIPSWRTTIKYGLRGKAI